MSEDAPAATVTPISPEVDCRHWVRRGADGVDVDWPDEESQEEDNANALHP